jgi:GNAT superfamily N-acetyltransferase
MVRLVPMSLEEFEVFMELSMQDQAEGQVQAGTWRAEEASAHMEMLRSQFLPAGMDTPGHYFFAVVDANTGETAGGLWYLVAEEEGNRQFFVMDIQIYGPYRRRGYGSQAFRAMEEKAREMGVGKISLHVFRHNHPARAMYVKLGYTGTSTKMSKQIVNP